MTASAKVELQINAFAVGRAEWLVFAGACVLRLAVGFLTRSLFYPETFEYDRMARSFVTGHGLAVWHLDVLYHSFAPPLHPLLSAASYWIFGSLTGLMILQVVAGGALAVVSAAIAKRLFGASIALFSAVLVAVHPGLIVYSVAKAHPLTFDALFFALAVLQAFRLRERTTVRRAIELGVIVGVGALCRATLIIFLPLVALWLFWVWQGPSLKPVVRAIAIAGLCSAAIVIPWTIRCSLLHHRFVFMLTTDAENFWRGNNPYATGASYATPEKLVLKTMSLRELGDLRGQPNEVAQADWFSTRSRAFVREHPDDFVRLTIQKLFYFWWLAPQTGVEYPKWWFVGYTIYYLQIILCAIIGAWTIWRSGRVPRQQLALIFAFLFALSVLQSLYYVEGRHRWAVEPILIAVSGGGLATLAQRSRRRLNIGSGRSLLNNSLSPWERLG